MTNNDSDLEINQLNILPDLERILEELEINREEIKLIKPQKNELCSSYSMVNCCISTEK